MTNLIIAAVLLRTSPVVWIAGVIDIALDGVFDMTHQFEVAVDCFLVPGSGKSFNVG